MLSNHPRPTDLTAVGKTSVCGNFGNVWYVRKQHFDFAVDFACFQNTVVNRSL